MELEHAAAPRIVWPTGCLLLCAALAWIGCTEDAQTADSRTGVTHAVSARGPETLRRTSGEIIPIRSGPGTKSARGGVGRCVSKDGKWFVSGFALDYELQERPLEVVAAAGRTLDEIESTLEWNKRPDLTKNEVLGAIRLEDIGFELEFPEADDERERGGVLFFALYGDSAVAVRYGSRCTGSLRTE